MQNIINIFTAPTQAFESLNEKPTWLVPLIIMIVVVVGFQYLTLDITMEYQIAMMEARDLPEASINAAKQQMSGGFKYIGMVGAVIFIPIAWVVIAAILLGMSKITISQGVDFKRALSIVAWSSLIGVITTVLTLVLVMSKGTLHGVVLDLAAVLDTPPMGESKSLMYRIFSKIDPFTIWQLILWTIGLKVMGKVEMAKAATPVAIIWIVWVVLSVSLGGFFEQFGM